MFYPLLLNPGLELPCHTCSHRYPYVALNPPDTVHEKYAWYEQQYCNTCCYPFGQAGLHSLSY